MKLSKFWISIISIVACITIIAVILGVVPIKNAPDIADSDSLKLIELYTSSTTKQIDRDSEDFAKITKAYNNTRKFSVLRGILVGQAGGMKLTSDEEDELFEESDIRALSANSSTHMIVFKYNSLQSVKVRGVVFEFNEAKILVSDTDNEIGTFTIALYNTEEFFIAPHGPGNEKYSIRYINAKGKCTKLYTAINDAVENS